MGESNEMIASILDELGTQVMVLEPGDLMSYGDVLSRLEQLAIVCEGMGGPELARLADGLKTIMEQLILGQREDQAQGVAALAEGLTLAQALLRAEAPPGQPQAFLAAQDLAPASPQAQPPETPPAAMEMELEMEAPLPAEPEAEAVEPPNDEDMELLTGFVTEAMEHLQSIEVNTLVLEDSPEDQEAISAVFRPFHTIKGVSGFLNLLDINHLAHALENLLDQARSGRLLLDSEAIDVILAGVDQLKQMILEAQEAAFGSRGRRAFDTSGLEARVNGILSGEAAQAQAAPPPPAPKLGEVMVDKGLVQEDAVVQALEAQLERPDKPLGEILVQRGAAEPVDVAEGLKAQKAAQPGQAFQQAQEVKIDTLKLDNLLDMVGELVIAQSMVAANPRIISIADRKLSADLAQLTRITSDLQKTTMAMRMVPIKQTFQKMVRVVRDTAKKQGKLIRLELVGETTEIDRNMVEKFYDPLVHMVRNSVDHGIETPPQRDAAGKPAEGTVVLSAYHKGGAVCIEITDDGRGLDKERIIAKALERGLVEDPEGMSDEEVYHLVMQPGFSTAETVTDISGRGVGMDVVQRAIEELRGKVEIKSTLGKGSSFIIALPLTLAIIDGMVVQVGAERYILPTVSVAESLRPRREDYGTVQGRGEMIMIRGNLVPLVRLANIVNATPEHDDPWEALVVVVEHHGQRRCLLVDHLIGRQEVVIKSLGESLKEVKVVAGGAIMGDGKVGLILDLENVFKFHETRR
jgi:two-component system chemotaxis sensor kinase CheA